ncbi:LacI family DNA-binding transcriptional regulator [Paenibacillus ferrarius]|uniref:LacI family DNA-binding transcriptional regulator n=1 Tax=Paenibacillus ferrarius TaxID=1469647 RepID=UPI003D2ACE79
MSKVTINDIAKAANVAKSTVSKVLNDSPTIPEATKIKIRDIMKQMNYIPSSIATQLAKQSSYNIGVLIDMSRKHDFLNHFFYTIIGGIENVIGTLNYELTICNSHAQSENNFLERLVLNKKVDGLIMDNTILTASLARQLNDLRFPFVSLGGLAGVDSVSWVDIDNIQGAGMITEHLLQQGYNNFAFIGGETHSPLFTNRYEGVQRTLQRFGKSIPDEHLKIGFANEDNGYRLMQELLALPALPDAVVCINNYTAFGVLKAIREHGLSIPDQIGIATFDNYPLAPYTTPPLTSLDLDTFELGVTAGTMLTQRIADPHKTIETRLIEPSLIIRESTQRLGR